MSERRREGEGGKEKHNRGREGGKNTNILLHMEMWCNAKLAKKHYPF